MHFLVEYAQETQEFKDQLRAIAELSKTRQDLDTASSNSMTILVQAGVLFNGADLQEIRIPDADLSGGNFDYAQLQDSDMTGVNFTKTWLRGADFTNAQMNKVQFGERPYLEVPGALTMALSTDKKILALGCRSGEIKALDTADWNTRHTLEGHTDIVNCVMFSSTGLLIAFGSEDTFVRIWNLQGDTDSYALQGHTWEVTSVAFSPNGLQLVSGSGDRTVRVWNLDSRTSTLVLTGHASPVQAVAWSPNGEQTASGSSDGILRLWKASSGVIERIIEFLKSKKIWTLLYIPSNQRLIAGSHGGINIWDLQTESEPLIFNGQRFDTTALAISPDGRWIVSASIDRSAKIWSEKTGELVHTFNGHSNIVLGAAFLNNHEAVSLEMDGRVRIWELNMDTEQKAASKKQRHSGCVRTAVYSPDGKTILSGGDDATVREWDAETGCIGTVVDCRREVYQVAYSPDGNHIAISVPAGNLQLIDGKFGTESAASIQDIEQVTTACYSPSGRWLATGYFEGAKKLWDLQSGAELCALEGHTDDIRGLVFAPNGQQLVSWSEIIQLVFGIRRATYLNQFMQRPSPSTLGPWCIRHAGQ